MNWENRFVCAIFFAIICWVFLFLGGGAAACLTHAIFNGLDRAPEMFGWLGLFAIIGLNAALFGSPIALIFSIIVFRKKNWSFRQVAYMAIAVGATGAVFVDVTAIAIEKSHIFSTETTIAMYYSGNTTIHIRGDKRPFREYSFTDLYTDSGGRPLDPDFALVMNNKTYPLGSLTTSSLNSLGFGVKGNHGYAKAELDQRYFRYRFSFHPEGKLVGFAWQAHVERSPIGFTYKGSPEIHLPMTEEEVDRVFGKPDKIHTYHTGPL